LAQLWGYPGYQAIARGVVTPKSSNKIVLFVTKEKQRGAEPYQGDMVGSTLTWDGPTYHFAEGQMKNAGQTGEQIHLFYRTRHHSAFRYEGQLEVIFCQTLANQPSRFKIERK
jgi:hypothetical protein